MGQFKARRGRAQGHERPMGTTAYGGKGFQESVRVSGEMPIGTEEDHNNEEEEEEPVAEFGVPGHGAN